MPHWLYELAPVEQIEEDDVTRTLALIAGVRGIGAMRLLLRRLNWDRLFSSANPHFERGMGAPTPKVARATHTRQAKRDEAGRQRARRAIMSDRRQRDLRSLLS